MGTAVYIGYLLFAVTLSASYAAEARDPSTTFTCGFVTAMFVMAIIDTIKGV